MSPQNPHFDVPARLEARPSRRTGIVRELKLLFAALGAGTSVVPMGDNSRSARFLAEYAASLRRP